MFIINGVNSKGENIKGTPKARNSYNYLMSTTTTFELEKTVLKKENSPYYVNNTLTLPEGKNLTIEPGVVIKIKGGSAEFLNILGELNALGSESENIVFTSFYDDEYGGDLNRDGGSSVPNPGDWAKIIFERTSSSTISYTKFRYGGMYYGFCCNGMVKIENATSTIVNSIFENSFSYGLELVNSNSYIADNVFRNNNNIRNFSGPSGLNIGSGSPKILNNIFQDNFIGINVSGGGAAEIENNIFNNNTNKAIYVIGNDGIGIFKNNSGVLTGGDTDGIYITDFKSRENATTTLYSNSFPYVFNNNPLIKFSSALVIKPGILIKNNESNRIEVFGALITEGVNPSDIIFTSFYDPRESYWFGISANPGSFVRLSGATIKNGGRIFSWGALEKEAALYIDNADAVIENSLFENNYKNGIIAVNASPSIKNTEFKNHLSPMFNSRGISYYNSKINLDNIAFRNNFLGIYADAASILGTVSDIVFEGNTGTSTISLFP